MKLQIYHTVNAGLYIWNGKSGLLVDALHGGKNLGFSDTPDRYVQMMERKESFFGQQNDLLFTHTHEDHYDPKLAERFLEMNPDSFIYGPGLDRSNVQPVVLETGSGLIQIRDYTIYTFKTEHDGKPYAGCPHCSYLVQFGGQCLWISGDAVLEASLADQVKAVCGGRQVDAAFVMVYQIGSKAGKEFLEKLSPNTSYLYHLPYKEDDVHNYYRLAQAVTERRSREGVHVTIPFPDSFISR